jgi:transposase
MMDEIDTRTLNQEAQEEIRRQAMRLIGSGKSKTEVAGLLGVGRSTVSRWFSRYNEGGWSALRKRKRGRAVGTNCRLNAEQQKQVQKTIVDKMPDQLKMTFALWSRRAVQQLIKDQFGVSYTLQGVGILLKDWGFTPQRPAKRAIERNDEAVKKWKEVEYPQLAARAKAEKAEIWWADETAAKPECHFRRSYSPKGKTPVVKQSAKRFHSSMISALNNQGKLEWMALKDPMNSEMFLTFLKQMIKYRRHKIILIVDNLKVHHSHVVQDWVEANKERIELVFLPAYSPQINPDEYLNNGLKQAIASKQPAKDKVQLDAMVEVFMLMLSAVKKHVIAFFHHPAVTYAACPV